MEVGEASSVKANEQWQTESPPNKSLLSAPARSTSANCRSKDVRIHAVVITELEFRDIQRKVLFADLVESTDHAARLAFVAPLNDLRSVPVLNHVPRIEPPRGLIRSTAD